MQDVILTVLGAFALLAVASLMLPLARRFEVPYTVLLALFGAGIGFLAVADFDIPSPFDELLHVADFHNLPSDAFLYVFLPPLLFSAGLGVNVRRLMDDVGAVIVLAIIAVIMCTAIVGAAVNLVSPSQGIVAALLLGAIVATTDAAAVVTIFRDIGAPKRLTIIIEGESLFNDAAAIAIFTMLLVVITEPERSVMEAGLITFTYGLAGGCIFGFLLARVFAWLIGILRDVALTEITLTLCLAYVAYIVAQHYLGVSGVIAVVTAAIVFGSEGRTRVSPETWGSLIQTWDLVNFIATTFIFTLASMIAPRALLNITQENLIVIVTIFVAAIIARALVLYGLIPALSRYNLAAPISNSQKAILVLGGLRGAVTVALALAISENDAVPAEIRDFVLVSATGFVFMTLIVMAPTLRPLMKIFRLEALSDSERVLRDRVMSLARARVRGQAKKVAQDLGLSGSLVPHEIDAAHPPTVMPVSKEERSRFGLVSLASREFELYMTYFTQGIVDRRIASYLRADTGRMVDAALTGGTQQYLKAARDAGGITNRFRRALWLQRRLGWSGPLASVIADRFEMMIAKQLALKDMTLSVVPDIALVIGEDAAAEIQSLIEARSAIVADALEFMDLQYPSYSKMLRARYLERVALGFEDVEYREQLTHALISQEVFEDLQQERRARLRGLEQRPTLDLGLKLAEMLLNVPFFTELDRRALQKLSHQLTPRLAVPGEKVIAKGEAGDSMYFIATGRVDVVLGQETIRLKPGDFFGEMALLDEAPRNADVIAVGFCSLLVLSRRDFRRFLRSTPQFRTQIETIAARRHED